MILLPTQTPVGSSDLKTKMASFAFDVFYIYIFLLHKFSFGNYTALYQTILNSINLCLHFLSSVTFKHRHLTLFVFTKILPNNIPCTHLHLILFKNCHINLTLRLKRLRFFLFCIWSLNIKVYYLLN